MRGVDGDDYWTVGAFAMDAVWSDINFLQARRFTVAPMLQQCWIEEAGVSPLPAVHSRTANADF